ncbi:division plane positioning ATPase MipZ [Bauldia sp.]|uniref:division plane positioning ATPase MipZ n=1 Tax=Bauldia sp. TaxID=2575872 RepID=UPI003BAC3994
MAGGPKSPTSAHLIVLGNEKGGSGKSTTAVHLIVALLKAGYRVASVDTDSRQLSLTRYIENRARFARERGILLEIPTHYVARLAAGQTVSGIEAQEFANYVDIIDRVESDFDYVVVDTPANDSYLMRLSHAMADTLITPINDSLVDLDLLGGVADGGDQPNPAGHYAELVAAARRQRQQVDGVLMDWIVVRNRLSMLSSRNQQTLLSALESLAAVHSFRLANGISERVVFRQFFASGLTALDTLDLATQGVEPTISHLAARHEIRDLVAMLGPPPAERVERATVLPAAVPQSRRQLASVGE